MVTKLVTFFSLVLLSVGCSKGPEYLSNECSLVDTQSIRGTKTYGRKGTNRTLRGTYQIAVFKCKAFDTVYSYESLPLSFDPDIEILNVIPNKITREH